MLLPILVVENNYPRLLCSEKKSVKLTLEQKEEIKWFSDANIKISDLSRMYKVYPSAIFLILNPIAKLRNNELSRKRNLERYHNDPKFKEKVIKLAIKNHKKTSTRTNWKEWNAERQRNFRKKQRILNGFNNIQN